jgi:hypothetical protein
MDGSDWYSPDIIKNILGETKIDLLFVDGPLAYKKSNAHSRYPAIPILKDYLAEDFTIILDDINRKGEQTIIRKWSQELGRPYTLRRTKGGIGIIRGQTGQTI